MSAEQTRIVREFQRRRSLLLFAIALLYTLLNAAKPLLIDDTAYYYVARQIAHDPLRPYDFQSFWYQYPHPAIEILAPPGLPYWWSIAYALFGERPFFWKLWLLPYSALFVFALHALFRRFARGLEMPLLLLTVFSPTFLPSFNLMLDVPALALSLGASAIFFRAAGRRSLGLAVAAGLLAGLGMETKYTAFLAPCVILLYALLFRRLLLGLLAATVAAGFFVGWEAIIYLYHGQSHFLVNLADHHGWELLGLAAPLLTLVGGVCLPLILLSLAAFGVQGWKVVLTGSVLALGYVAIVAANAILELEEVIFGLFGLLGFGLLTACGLANALSRKRLDLFLFCWLLGETSAFFFLTPFPAVRRIMGVMVVATLVVGRLASRTCRSAERRRLVHGITAFGIGLGALFAGVDFLDAITSQRLAESAAEYIQKRQAGARVWYVGHWGFQYYAERAGMRPVVPDDSWLGAGDWLVVPEPRLNQQLIHVEPNCTKYLTDILIEDSVPLRTVQCFYGGTVPLEHHDGPRGRVMIYKVYAAFVPRSKWE